MEKIIHGQPIKRGQILEVVFNNVKHPIKAAVLDVIGYSTGSNSKHYECIMYAQKSLFKASFEYNWSIEDIYNELDISEKGEVHYYSDLKYEGIIVGYCEMPAIPSDI